MYVYINSQGRVLETITSEQVNQGSDLANRIHFHVEGLSRTQNPTVTAQFRLPDGTTVAKPISANVEDPGYLPESNFDYRVFKPDYPYLFWYCDLDSDLLAQDGTLQCSLIVQIGGQTVITTVQGMITIAVKESAVDDPNLTLSQYEYLLYQIGDQTAGKYVLKVGDTMSGPLSVPSISTDSIESIGGNAVEMPNGIHAIGDTMSVTLDASGLHIDGTANSTYMEYDAIGISRASNYIKFSFSGSSPIIETVNGGSAIKSYMPSKSGFLGVLADDVASAYLGYRNEDGHLFLEITKQDGSTINSDVDLPLESAIVGMTYDHDTQTITFTLTSGATLTVPVSDIFQGVVTLDNGGWARENQMSVAIVYDNLTNINGKALTSFTSEPYDDGTYQGYYILTADDEAFLTKEQAAVYMKAMTGSDYVPEYDYDHPTNSYFIFAAGKTLWKPQWSETIGLVLYSMKTTMVDAESDQTIMGIKTFANDMKLTNGTATVAFDFNSSNDFRIRYGSANAISIYANGNDIGIAKNLNPSANNSKDLGNSSYKWKDGHFNGKLHLYSETSNDYNLYGDGAWLTIKRSNVGIVQFYDTIIKPYTNNSVDLGTSGQKFKDLYLAGNLSDGVNSFSAATIANLIRINALAVSETSYSSVLPMTIPSVVGSAAIVDDSKMRIKSIKGKCVAWNQMIENGNFADNTLWSSDANVSATYSNGSVAISILANGYGAGIRQQTVARCVSGHKYLIKCVGKSSDAAVGLRVTQYSYGPGATVLSTGNVALGTAETVYGVIATASATSFTGTDWRIACIRTNGTSVSGDSATIRNLQVFDLTLIYGAGNEPTTVAEFAADFPEAYYEYDAGSIKGSTVTKITSQGRNLFDGEIGNYKFDNNTGAGSSGGATAFGSVHRIKVKPSTSYVLKFLNFTSSVTSYLYVGEYDANGNFLVRRDGWSASNPSVSFTTNGLTAEIAFYIYTSNANYQTNLPIDPQIMLVEGSTAPTEYEPYFKETLAIPSSIRGYAENGVGSEQDILDVEGKRAIAHCAEITMGSLTWLYAGSNLFYTALPGAIDTPNANVGALVCGKYATAPRSGLPDKSCCISGTDIVVKDTEYSSAATFQSAVSSVKIVYGLATPTSADISADLEGFDQYLDIKVGGKVDCDCEVKPTLEASFAAYE